MSTFCIFIWFAAVHVLSDALSEVVVTARHQTGFSPFRDVQTMTCAGQNQVDQRLVHMGIFVAGCRTPQ